MWIFEEIKRPAYFARWGPDLVDTDRYDPFTLSCLILDMGDGIAYAAGAVGNSRLPSRDDFMEKLRELGFRKVRWIRVAEFDLEKRRGSDPKEC
jgi:hypothetical protein